MRGRPQKLPADPAVKKEMIRRHYQVLGMTYENIAKKFGVTRMTIWRWRNL